MEYVTSSVSCLVTIVQSPQTEYFTLNYILSFFMTMMQFLIWLLLKATEVLVMIAHS